MRLPDMVVPFFKKSSWLWLFAWLGPNLQLQAQAPPLPAHSRGEQLLERLEIQSGGSSIHPELRPYNRRDALEAARRPDSFPAGRSRLSQIDLQYLFDDNNEWARPADSNRLSRNARPLFKTFFRTPAHLFEVNTPDFHLRVNPLLHFATGPEQQEASWIFLNQRGLEVRGALDGRVYFFTNILETQARFPNYVQEWIGRYQAVPGAGFFKNFESEIFQVRQGYDFNLAQAGIGIQATRHISVELGHGQHFIGNGYRSLFLSGVGNYTFYLKFNTRVWRLHYQNLFLELSPISTAVPRPQNSLLPKKYIAAHYLNVKITPRLAFGFFEATVFNRSRQFELQYLNPVILYRSVEGAIGSPDNVLIGLDGRWNFLSRFQLYGQLLIDEFLLSALYKPEQKGWWGNKFGAQLGLKYLDAFGIDHFDLQVEFNSVRPYTYSSFDSLNSYTHYNQPLAHPLWANFREWIALARLQPSPRLYLSARLLYAKAGENPDAENFGANPLLGNVSRAADYGNFTGQGEAAAIWLAGAEASWELYHNLFAEARCLLREKHSVNPLRDQNTAVFSLGLRWNIWSRPHDF